MSTPDDVMLSTEGAEMMSTEHEEVEREEMSAEVKIKKEPDTGIHC